MRPPNRSSGARQPGSSPVNHAQSPPSGAAAAAAAASSATAEAAAAAAESSLGPGQAGAGEVTFPLKKGVRIFPVKGRAIMFWSRLPDGSEDSSSIHAAEVVQGGQKWITTRWFTDMK